MRACPFCGGERTTVKTVWKSWKFVACDKCKAGGPVRRSEQEAVAAWDERAEMVQERLWGDGNA